MNNQQNQENQVVSLPQQSQTKEIINKIKKLEIASLNLWVFVAEKLSEIKGLSVSKYFENELSSEISMTYSSFAMNVRAGECLNYMISMINLVDDGDDVRSQLNAHNYSKLITSKLQNRNLKNFASLWAFIKKADQSQHKEIITKVYELACNGLFNKAFLKSLKNDSAKSANSIDDPSSKSANSVDANSVDSPSSKSANSNDSVNVHTIKTAFLNLDPKDKIEAILEFLATATKDDLLVIDKGTVERLNAIHKTMAKGSNAKNAA